MISGKNEKYWLYQNSKANCAFQITFPQNAENKNSTLTLEFIKGYPITDVEKLNRDGIDEGEIA